MDRGVAREQRNAGNSRKTKQNRGKKSYRGRRSTPAGLYGSTGVVVGSIVGEKDTAGGQRWGVAAAAGGGDRQGDDVQRGDTTDETAKGRNVVLGPVIVTAML